jgi:hypothetical protein
MKSREICAYFGAACAIELGMASKSAKPRMGRPSIPPGERRTNRIHLNLTDAQVEAYAIAAAALGVPPVAWARAVLDAAACGSATKVG